MRTKKASMRHLISQFVKSADFIVPYSGKSVNVKAPTDNISNAGDKALFTLKTEVNRRAIRADKNQAMFLEITIYFNNQLTSSRAYQRPFSFTYPLEFNFKEKVETMTLTFDAEMVKKIIKVEEFQKDMLNVAAKEEKKASDDQINTGNAKTTQLSKYVTQDNYDCGLVIRFLSPEVEAEDIVNFFGYDAELDPVFDIHIEDREGKNTVSALVLFKSPEKAQLMKKTKNHK